MNWGELREESALDVDDVKERLPIPYVLEQHGIELFDGDDGRLHALCPFHEDHDPSLDVYGERLERFGCFACNAGGDVLDLIQRLEGLATFPEVKARGIQYLREMEGSDWSGPRVGNVKRVFDAEAARELVQASEVVGLGAVSLFLEGRSDPGLADVEPEWLQEQWRLGSSGNELVIPYYNRKGELVTYKRRPPGEKPLAAPGSDFASMLYGEWRDTDPRKPVLLVEGESDAWAAQHALPEFVVLALPRGAHSRPVAQGTLARRRVVLAFDGDAPGRSALVEWYAALVSHEAEVRIVPLPEGYDLAELQDLRSHVLGRQRAVPAAPVGLKRVDDTYVRPGKEVNTPLSNWVFEPERELQGEDGTAYEGRLLPGGKAVVLTTADLSSKSRTVSWAAQHGVSWYGTERDSQLLLGQIQARGPFLSVGALDTVAGLQDRHFVWPGGRIGPDYRVYSPPAADVHLENDVHLTPGPTSPSELLRLRELHLPEVMDPILAWAAVAPLRSLLRQFPVLAVTGSSGTGKTTLIETVLRRFSGTQIQSNLTSTTRHAIFAYVGSTNAFPVWFDEYRPGARREALETIDQVMRDAYTRQGSAKGGMRERWSEVVMVHAEAPLVVSGEDAFTETSHIERMVPVPLPREGRNPGALNALRGVSGLPHAYLSWLHEGLVTETLPLIENYERGPEHLQPRQRYNLGLLDLGWRLLGQFAAEVGVDLGDPHFGRVIEKMSTDGESSPIQDALLWALEEADAMNAVVESEGAVYVRVENFVKHARDKGGFVLPGGPAAVRDFIIEEFGARKERTAAFPGQRQTRALVFPREALD